MRTGIVAISLLAATTLALAQAPPPPPGGGSGGSGGSGGNQPTITWTYTGTKTIFNGHRTDTFPVQSATDLSASLASFSPKIVKIEATVKATVEWPSGATVPEYQWFKLDLKSSSSINSGYAGTVIADNGWSDAATGTSGRSSISSGKHLIRRKVENGKVEIEYDLVGEASGTHPATGMGSVVLEAGLQLTDRKLIITRQDGGEVLSNDNGDQLLSKTLRSTWPGLTYQNVLGLNADILGTWNYNTSLVGMSPKSDDWQQTKWHGFSFIGTGSYQFEVMMANGTQSALWLSAIDQYDGYSFRIDMQLELHYALEDWSVDETEDWFLCVNVFGPLLVSSGPGTLQLQVTDSTTIGVSASHTFELGLNGGISIPLEPVHPSIMANVGFGWTATKEVSNSSSVGGTYSVPRSGFYRLGYGTGYYRDFGTVTTWNLLGVKAVNVPAVNDRYVQQGVIGYIPVHGDLFEGMPRYQKASTFPMGMTMP